MRPIVVVTQTRERPVDLDTTNRILSGVADIRPIDYEYRHLHGQDFTELMSKIADASAMFMRTGFLTGEMITAMPQLQIVALHGAGLNQVDVEAATRSGVMVTNAPGGNSEAVAEHAFGLLLALLRGIPRADRLVREQRWEEGIFNGVELRNKVLGIVGFGQIGRRVARIAKGFEMSVVGYDPYISAAQFRESGATKLTLAGVLSEADILTIHVPLDASSRHLIGGKELSLAKKGAFVVNTSRGGIIDESELYRALAAGRLAGAALDVFEVEPVEKDNPLLSLDNVVVSPHMAGVTYEVTTPIAEIACADIARVLNGERPTYLCNPGVIAAHRG